MYHCIDLLASVRGSFDPAKGQRFSHRFMNADGLGTFLQTERDAAEELRDLYDQGAELIQTWMVKLYKDSNDWRPLPHSHLTLREFSQQLPDLWTDHCKASPRGGDPRQHWIVGKAALLGKLKKTIQKNHMGLWSATKYKAGTTRRLAENVDSLGAAVLDYDVRGPRLSEVIQHFEQRHITAIAHETFSSMEHHQKFRVILLFEERCPAEKWKQVWRAIIKLAPGQPDPKCSDPNRMYFCNYGTALGQGKTDAYWGMPLDWRKLDLEPEPSHVYKEVKNSHPRTPLYDGEQQFTTRPEREALAMKLGGRLTSTRATKITCPRCGRDDVWFFLDPGKKLSASCNHDKNCQWVGGLWRLAQ